MAPANPEKRREVRRLVEEEGLSMGEAGRRVGAGERSVIRWQAQDAEAGNPWVLKGEASLVAKNRADELTPEERQRRTDRARRAALAWRDERRQEEAAAAGVAAMQYRTQLQNALPHLARSFIESGEGDTEGLRAQRLASAIRSAAITYGVLIDKADALAGFRNGSGTVVEERSAAVEGDVAEAAVTLLAEIRERRASA